MATQGTITGLVSQRSTSYRAKLYWKQVSQNIANNTTTIRVWSMIENYGTSANWSGNCSSWSMFVNNVNRTRGTFGSDSLTSWTYPSGWTNSGYVITTSRTELVPEISLETPVEYEEFTITHNTDGTKQIELELTYSLPSAGWGPGNVDIFGTATLETIPRASIINTFSNFTAVDTAITNLAVGVTSYSSDFDLDFTLKYGANVIATWNNQTITTVNGNQSYVLPLSIAQQQTLIGLITSNPPTGTVTLHCQTQIKLTTTNIGNSTSKNATVTVSASIIPSVTISTTGVSLLNGRYVQSKSKVSVVLNEDIKYGASIVSRSTTVKYGATLITSSTSALFTSATIIYSGTISINTTITDSRGRTGTSSTSISVVSYFIPQALTLVAYRCLSNGTADPVGEFMKLTATGSISSIENQNTNSTLLRYRITGGTWVNPQGPPAQTNPITTSYTPSFNLDPISINSNDTYEVELRVSDYYTSASPTVRTVAVSTAFVLMDFHSSGNSMAIGKAAQNLALLDVGGDILWTGGGSGNANTAYTHSQAAHAPSTAQANQTLTSGNGMATWTATSGNLTIVLGTPSNCTASTSSANTSTSHTHAITGFGAHSTTTFTPIARGSTTAGTTTYTTQSGRYVKVGSLVFFTMEMTWSGFTGTGVLQIVGLPFSASGYTAVSLNVSNYTFTTGYFPQAFVWGTSVDVEIRTASGAGAAMPIDTNAGLRISGCYYTTS